MERGLVGLLTVEGLANPDIYNGQVMQWPGYARNGTLRNRGCGVPAVNDVVIARVVHVLAVVIWIGGVAMVTTIILPIVRASGAISLLEAVERRFVWQARLSTLLVGASGFYMVARLSLWDRFDTIEFWWMHAMVLVWLIFSLILFVGEPLIVGRSKRVDAVRGTMVGRIHVVHWLLLMLATITIVAAVAGSQGMLLVP